MENKGCLFTKDDWDHWYEIQSRTKTRPSNFSPAKHQHKYTYKRCIFCKKRIVSYLLTKHLDQNHREKFHSWDEERAIINRCKTVD